MPDIIEWATLIAVWSGAYFSIVTVHELGHYLAGLLIGVPRRNMRIRLWCFPQHVALRDGHDWVSPLETERFVKLAEAYMPTSARAMTFVAGGFLLESIVLLSWVILRLPFHRVAITLAILMTLLYLVADVAAFLKTRRASMDFTALFLISPIFGTATAVAVIALQCFTFYIR